ncbi:MAG: hypothetical protein Kow00128_17050 [Deltaproteobacteria bacterium]
MDAMRIALLGATGFVGRSAAADLARRPEVRELLLVDYDIRSAKRFARTLSPKCRWSMSDVGREADLGRLLERIDAVASAVGPGREYDRRVLSTCAACRTPAAVLGDEALPPEDRREIDGLFRRQGIAAVSGCGLLPGWTELLAAHFLPAGEGRTRERFLFCRPDRFGGYAFFRRIVRQAGAPALPPPGAPPGAYFAAGTGVRLGVPSGKAGSLFRRLAGPGPFGAVGREFSTALLLWLRRFLSGSPELPAAAAGLFDPSGKDSATCLVLDLDGRLPGATLAETTIRLAETGESNPGLRELPEILGREDARRVAAVGGARIGTGGTGSGPG